MPQTTPLMSVRFGLSFGASAKKVSRAFAELLDTAGVSFAILGSQESCTGDPARRLGNEYLFQEMAKANIELLNETGVKKIVAGSKATVVIQHDARDLDKLPTFPASAK